MLHDAQVTTVCAWLNTVVLHEAHKADGNVRTWLPPVGRDQEAVREREQVR